MAPPCSSVAVVLLAVASARASRPCRPAEPARGRARDRGARRLADRLRRRHAARASRARLAGRRRPRAHARPSRWRSRSCGRHRAALPAVLLVVLTWPAYAAHTAIASATVSPGAARDRRRRGPATACSSDTSKSDEHGVAHDEQLDAAVDLRARRRRGSATGTRRSSGRRGDEQAAWRATTRAGTTGSSHTRYCGESTRPSTTAAQSVAAHASTRPSCVRDEPAGVRPDQPPAPPGRRSTSRSASPRPDVPPRP